MPSLHQFGDATGCDYTTVSRLLSGERAPSTSLLARICNAYDLDEGEALRTLAADKSKGGKSTGFAAFLRAKVFDVAQVTSPGDDEPLVKESQPMV